VKEFLLNDIAAKSSDVNEVLKQFQSVSLEREFTRF